jgi:WD40 repeat protein
MQRINFIILIGHKIAQRIKITKSFRRKSYLIWAELVKKLDRGVILLLFLVPMVFGEELVPTWRFESGSGIWSVATSDSGDRVVTGSWDQNIYLLDSNGNLLWEFNTQGSIWTVDMDAFSTRIVAGSQDKYVYFLDAQGNLLWKYLTGDTVWTVDISRDGTAIIAGSYDDYIYSLKDGRRLWKFKTGDNVLSVAVSDDGGHVIAGSWDRNVYFLDSTGRLLWSFPTDGIVGSVAISGDGQYAIAGSHDNKIYTFDSSGRLIGSYRVSSEVLSVDISRNGRFVAAGSRNGRVYVFELTPEPGAMPSFGRLTGQYETKGEIWGIDMSSSGERVVAASTDGNIYILDSKAKLLAKYETVARATSVAITADGKKVVAGSFDNNVYFLDVEPFPVEKEEELPVAPPELVVTRNIANVKLVEGEFTTVKLELRNIGGQDAIAIEVVDSPPSGLEVVAGEKEWKGELKPGESSFITYRLRAGEVDEKALYELPGLDVTYRDPAGKIYHAFVDPVLIVVEPMSSVELPEEEPVIPHEPVTPPETPQEVVKEKTLLESPLVIAGLATLSIILIWFGWERLYWRPTRVYRTRVYRKDRADLLKYLKGVVTGEPIAYSPTKAIPRMFLVSLLERLYSTIIRRKTYNKENVALLKKIKKKVSE